mmetsp:Transcript_10834/g.22988  ORF Transcript_10834/g.22988 Transcript_10834/m.22988 type:complete len:447 (+) Transcript_10834:106-1446(+)
MPNMEQPVPAAATDIAAPDAANSAPSTTAPDTQANPSSSSSSPGNNKDKDDTPIPSEKPLSKNQLKKRRRYEKSQAIKKRRKEQSRELRRLKAVKEGRDLAAERQQQLANEKEGKGWKKREERWKEIMECAKIDESFRVCFDCAFEDDMSWKETNSLGLQLRYTYAVNRKSTHPVYIDICGLKVGGQTRGHLEKVEGFPERWVGRAFQCYEEGLEEVYGRGRADVVGKNGEADTIANDANEDGKSDKETKEGQESSAKTVIATNTKNDSNNDDATAAPEKADDSAASASQPPSYPKLRPNHQFVYLTGDSPNTLTTLDDNTTYIIGGIVDRNRLKRAAIDRAESIAAAHPSLDIKTARLPLDENIDFKGATRILTCNHVFEILQKYRENGYGDWRGAIMAVMPDRKDLEERGDDAMGIVAKEAKGAGVDGGKKDDPVKGNKDFIPV